VGVAVSCDGGAADSGRCDVRVVIEPDPEAGPEDAERLTRQLRDELRKLDLDVVIPRSSEEPPPHAKGGGDELPDGRGRPSAAAA